MGIKEELLLLVLGSKTYHWEGLYNNNSSLWFDSLSLLDPRTVGLSADKNKRNFLGNLTLFVPCL